MNEPFSRHPSAAVISATPRASHGLKGLSAWHAERLLTLPGRVTARPRESPAGVAFVGARTSKPASSSSLQPQEPRVRLAVGSLWNLHLRAWAAQAADSTATRAVSIHPHKHSTSSSPSSSQPCRRAGQPASSSRVERSRVGIPSLAQYDPWSRWSRCRGSSPAHTKRCSCRCDSGSDPCACYCVLLADHKQVTSRWSWRFRAQELN